jgi:hypothetical protein
MRAPDATTTAEREVSAPSSCVAPRGDVELADPTLDAGGLAAAGASSSPSTFRLGLGHCSGERCEYAKWTGEPMEMRPWLF